MLDVAVRTPRTPSCPSTAGVCRYRSKANHLNTEAANPDPRRRAQTVKRRRSWQAWQASTRQLVVRDNVAASPGGGGWVDSPWVAEGSLRVAEVLKRVAVLLFLAHCLAGNPKLGPHGTVRSRTGGGTAARFDIATPRFRNSVGRLGRSRRQHPGVPASCHDGGWAGRAEQTAASEGVRRMLGMVAGVRTHVHLPGRSWHGRMA